MGYRTGAAGVHGLLHLVRLLVKLDWLLVLFIYSVFISVKRFAFFLFHFLTCFFCLLVALIQDFVDVFLLLSSY